MSSCGRRGDRAREVGLISLWKPTQPSTSGYLDLVQRLEFGVDNLQKNAVYQIE